MTRPWVWNPIGSDIYMGSRDLFLAICRATEQALVRGDTCHDWRSSRLCAAQDLGPERH